MIEISSRVATVKTKTSFFFKTLYIQHIVQCEKRDAVDNVDCIACCSENTSECAKLFCSSHGKQRSNSDASS